MPFPTFADYKGPWGEEEEDFDAEKAKKLLYNLDKDKYHIQGLANEAEASKKDLEKALAVYKTAEKTAKQENESELERFKREKEELETKLKEASNPRDTWILEVALEKGLTKKQAKRLQGENLEELLADADDYLEDIAPSAAGDDEVEDDDNEINLVRKPRRVKSPVDPDPGADMPYDLDKALASIGRF